MKGRCPKCSYGFEFEAAETVSCPSCGAVMKLRAKGSASGSGDARAGAGPAATPPPAPMAPPRPPPSYGQEAGPEPTPRPTPAREEETPSRPSQLKAPPPRAAPAKRAEPAEDAYSTPARGSAAKRAQPSDEDTYAPSPPPVKRGRPSDDEDAPPPRAGKRASSRDGALSREGREGVSPSRAEDDAGRDAGAKAAGPSLPETMRANKVVAGRVCPGCDKTISLGTDVHNCQACGSSHHAGCWDAAAGCAATSCALKAAEAAVDERPTRAGRARRPTSEVAGSTKPCKFCGEQILADVKKCRYCGEYQTAGERAMAQARQSAADPDADMGGAEWALAILCSGIGCIVGIVWWIQGKKKGPKMVGVSICVQVFWGLVRGCIEASQHSRY